MSYQRLLALANMPTKQELAQIYWIFVGGAIVIAALVNLIDKLIYRHRYVLHV